MARVALTADSPAQAAETGKWPREYVHVSDADSASASDAGAASAPAGSKTLAWMSAVLDSPGGPEHIRVLAALVMFLDWKTGAGWCSHEQMAGKADVCERVAKRATGWARSAGLLRQTRRGHRLSDGKSLASGWALLLPVPGEQPATESQGDSRVPLDAPKVTPESPSSTLSRDSTLSEQADSPAERTSPEPADRLSTEGAAPAPAVPESTGIVAAARQLFPDASPADVLEAVGRLGANDSKIRVPAAFIRSRKTEIETSLRSIAAARETARQDAAAQRARDQEEAARWVQEHPAAPPFLFTAPAGPMPEQPAPSAPMTEPVPLEVLAPPEISPETLAAFILPALNLGAEVSSGDQ